MSTPGSEKTNSQTPPTEAKVARIVTSSQIVLDVGASDGVTVGLRYRIIHPVDVYDPNDQSKKVMTLHYTKAIVEVTQVYQGLSLAQPPQQPPFGFGFLESLRTPTMRPELNVDESEVALPASALQIRVGDEVRLDVPDDE